MNFNKYLTCKCLVLETVILEGEKYPSTPDYCQSITLNEFAVMSRAWHYALVGENYPQDSQRYTTSHDFSLCSAEVCISNTLREMGLSGWFEPHILLVQAVSEYHTGAESGMNNILQVSMYSSNHVL